MKRKSLSPTTCSIALVFLLLIGCTTNQGTLPTSQVQSLEQTLPEDGISKTEHKEVDPVPINTHLSDAELSIVTEPIPIAIEREEQIPPNIAFPSDCSTAEALPEESVGSIQIPTVQQSIPTEETSVSDIPSESTSEQETIPDPTLPQTDTDTFTNIPETVIERPFMSVRFVLIAIITILAVVLAIFLTRINRLKEKLSTEKYRNSVFAIDSLEAAQAKKEELDTVIADTESQLATVIASNESRLAALRVEYSRAKDNLSHLQQNISQLDKRFENQQQKLARSKELYSAVEHAVTRFHATDIPSMYFRPLSDVEKADLDTIAPSVMLSLNYMNYQDLRKEFRVNQKQMDTLLENYEQRYTTKANQTMYKLMVISLRSELQNILYNLKHEKLDTALVQVQTLINKYIAVATEGNQLIAGTMKKFVGELEYLFENAVKIEYEYYIKKEQVRQEQLALRQQMKEEAEERKRLEEQRKQVAFEESKYHAEIQKVEELLQSESEDSQRRTEIILKLDELNTQLAQVEEKKEEITKLQNGKAGNVYIISNLGSFGDHVFKVGMTRRLDPQERVNELGDASVPFSFDVHSFIFSEDAVGLENELHRRLHDRRLNKVNHRKEFFTISIDELEQLVQEINPTAEFNRTMLAKEYNQSLSLGDQELPLAEIYDTDEEQEEDERLDA